MPTPDDNPQLQSHLDAVQRLRAAKYSWDDIHQYYADQVDRLRAAKYSEDDIRAYYGGRDPTADIEDMQARQVQNQRANQPTSLVDAFANGMTNSSGAALLKVAPRPEATQGFLPRLFSAGGEAIGDIPAGIAGAAVLSPVGAAAGGAAGAAVPGAGETGTSEALGAAAGAGIAGGFGGFAVPQLIKSERDAWAIAHANGWGLDKFIGAQMDVAKQTLEQGGVGALTMGMGGLATRALERAGVGVGVRTVAGVATEATTMTAAEAAVKGQHFSTEDLIDGAVLIGAMHAGVKLSGASMQGIRGRLVQNYQATGENPLAAARRAQTDPAFRRDMLGQPNPPAPAGSSRTPTETGDQFVVPRVASSFDQAVDFTLKHEGSPTVVDANGALVKWGINQADNPEVNVKGLSREDAAEIYKHKYWDAIGADDLPPNMRLAAFDTAVVEGVARAKEWLRESDGDVQQFLERRSAFEAKLARDNPEKYARYSRTWATRVRDLGGNGIATGVLGKDPNIEISVNEQAVLDAGGKPPEPPEPPKPPDKGEPGDDDFEKRIAAHVSRGNDPEGGWLSGTMDAASKLYTEIYNRDHPINRMVNAVTKGEPLDDFKNPMLLREMARRADTEARYTINGDGHGNPGGMMDMDGNVTGRSLVAIIEDAGDKNKQKHFLDVYAQSRWAQMMHAEGKETGLQQEDIDRAVTENPHLEPLFQELVGWRNSTLGWLKDSGVVSGKSYDDLTSGKAAAIPGYRDMGEGKWAPVGSNAGKNPFNPVKEARGSTRSVLPIEQSLMRDAMLRRALAASNRSNVVLADLAVEHGVGTEKRAVDFNVIKTMADLGQLKHIEGVDDMVSQLAHSAGQAVPKDQMPVMRDGKMYGVEFDPEYRDAIDAVRGYDQTGRSLFFKIAAAVTRPLRVARTTANPLFAPHILIMDTPFQHITNPDARNVLNSVVWGIGAATRDPKGYDEWLRKGAEHVLDHMSGDEYIKSVFKLEQDESPLAGVWNGVQTPFHALQAWNRMFFASLRYGRYVQGKEAGESDIRAGVASMRSAYHQLGRGGSVAQTVNAVVSFLSAHLTGQEKVVRSLIGGIPEKLSGGQLQNRTPLGTPYSAKSTVLRGLATLTVPAMLSWLAYKDQEWYKAMPNWQKDNAWVIIPPMNGGPPVPIGGPAALLSSIFIMLPRRFGEAFLQDNPHAFDDTLPSVGASVFGPAGLPIASFLQPFIEHITNHSFLRDQPLVSNDTMKQVGTPEQFNHYSSAEAKALSRAIGGAAGLSPAVIDNYIQAWGVPGQATQAASNAIQDQFSANKRPEVKIWELPPFHSYVQRYPAANAQPIIDFYNRDQALNGVHGSLVQLIKDNDLEGVRALARAHPNEAEFHALHLSQDKLGVNPWPYIHAIQAETRGRTDMNDLNLIKQGERAMQNANQKANAAWNNPRLSAQDKRQIINGYAQIMQGMAERIGEAMDRAHIGASHVSDLAPPRPSHIGFTPLHETVH